MSLIKWKGPTNALVFAKNSPTLEYGDRVRATDIYMGPQNLCAASMLARGTFGNGFRLGWVVNQCSCTNDRGGIGTLTIQWEAGGAYADQPLPVGDFDLSPEELYPKIERSAAFQSPNPITFTTLNISKCAVDLATNASGSPLVGADFLTKNIANGVNGYDSANAAIQLPLAQNLVAKWLRGEETYYLAGWRYWYEVYSYAAPTVSKGGITGTPGGPLAAALPSGVSWLRLADKVTPAGVNGSMFKNTISWLGGPQIGGVGYWDSDIYV
jgi:hypothetical protein